MKILILTILIGVSAWARGPANQCFEIFAPDELVHFSHADIWHMFNQEFKKLGPNPFTLHQFNLKRISPNLVTLEDFVARDEQVQELESSERYAKFVLGKKQEQLLLLSKFGKISVPGFDGIIYSKNGLPVANFTLKSSTGIWKTSLHNAIEKAYRYSVNEFEWFNSVTGKDFDQETEFAFYKSRWPQFFEGTFKSIVFLAKIFGIKVGCSTCTARPTRAVVHLLKDDVKDLTLEDIEYVHAQLELHRDYIESVALVSDSGALVVTHGSHAYITGDQ